MTESLNALILDVPTGLIWLVLAFLSIRARFFWTLLSMGVILVDENPCETSYTVLNTLDPQTAQRTLTIQIKPSLVDARVAHHISIHPTPSFHANPEKNVLSGTKTTEFISIQPALSLQR